jgi:crotonobetainyl-CoA:carnitine CoA-transferase CaiB-like acyl-CoA transferase
MPLLSSTPGGVDHLGPALGEHNVEIYGELMGIEAATLDDLARRGVI